MLFECCTLPRSDGWVWNVCGGGEREISSSASSKEKQPLTLHFPQICCEESRTPGEWQHIGDIITQMQVEWAQAQGTVKENSVPLALRSHLETQMEKEWLSAQHPCCKELQFIPPPCPESLHGRTRLASRLFTDLHGVKRMVFTLYVEDELDKDRDSWGPCYPCVRWMCSFYVPFLLELGSRSPYDF